MIVLALVVLYMLLVLICAVHTILYYTVYDPHRRSIKCKDADKFCDIAVLNTPALSESLSERVLTYVADPSHGTRIDVPTKKAGRTVSTMEILRDIPDLLNHYNAVARYVSEKFDEPIQTLIGISSLAMMILIYENEGDEISWHYDVNVFQGKQFTIVEPLSGFDTCTQFEYIDERGQVVAQKVKAGEAIMLQGDVLYHRSTRQCAGQSRVAIVMEFSTDPSKVGLKRIIDSVKRRFFY